MTVKKVTIRDFMSMKKKEDMPPLEKINGLTYWIEEGELK